VPPPRETLLDLCAQEAIFISSLSSLDALCVCFFLPIEIYQEIRIAPKALMET
jgi:hypothetical protein